MPWKAASGGGSRARSRAGSKTIRGQISGPIPISDPADDEFPMREPADDEFPEEFPMRQSATYKPETIERHSRIIDEYNTATRESPVVKQPDLLPVEAPDQFYNSSSDTDTSGNLPAAASSVVSGPGPQGLPQSKSTQSAPIRQSTATMSSGKGGQSDSMPKRKKSTLRSAFGRLFGRKKKRESKGSTSLAADRSTASAVRVTGSGIVTPNQQHTSDPTGDKRPQLQIETKRSFSMPITEYDRALRSHSIGPEDVMAIQSARNSLSTEARLSANKLSAIDRPTSFLVSPRWAGDAKLMGLTPRPASSHDRVTHLLDASDDDPSEIGRAISSDSHGLKRRSRSLSYMTGLENADQGETRRRSAEIRYWRESYAPAFISPTSEDPDVEATMETLPNDVGDMDDEKSIEHTALMTQYHEDEAHHVPPSDGSQGASEFAKSSDVPSLDSRIGNLESRMSRLEGIVLQLGNSIPVLRQQSTKQNRLPPLTPTPTQPKRTGGIVATNHSRSGSRDHEVTADLKRDSSRPSTQHSDVSKMTFGDVAANLDDRTPRATMRPLDTGPYHSDVTSLTPSLQRTAQRGLSLEHYTTLIALLDTERAAREALEAQVKSLGHQIQLMSKASAYTYTEHSDSPSLDRSLGEVSVFDHDDDDAEARRGTIGGKYTYGSLGLVDSGIATEDRDDDDYTEAFMTPHEDGREFGAYGNENDAGIKTDSRSLSLSLMTGGRQPLSSMPQVATQAI